MCKARRLLQIINNICRDRCQEIYSDPGAPLFIVTVAVAQIDPGLANASAADILHSGKPIAGNVKPLTLHAEVPAVAQSYHAFTQALATRGARVTALAAGAT